MEPIGISDRGTKINLRQRRNALDSPVKSSWLLYLTDFCSSLLVILAETGPPLLFPFMSQRLKKRRIKGGPSL